MRNQRRLNTTVRAAAAKPSAWDNIASGLPADPGFEAVKDQHRALTPRERLRLKKQQQADQRAMELRVASINMNPHREVRPASACLVPQVTRRSLSPRPQ